MMTSRERVLMAASHKAPDRVPTFFRRYCPSKEYELNDEQKNFLTSIADVGPYISFKSLENKSIVQRDSMRFDGQGDGMTFDELGIGYRKVKLYWERCYFPLAHMEDPVELRDYPWPDVRDKRRVTGLRDQAIKIRNEDKAVAVFGSWGGSTGIFELSWYMRGMERFLMDCVENVCFAEELLDKQLELHKGLWENILEEVGDIVDFACTGDDLGTQNSLLISPSLYRDLIKPRQKELISHIKKFTQAKIYYHSCGAIEPLIKDLIDIGVDVLDPIQPTALDTRRIKAEYGNELVFFGGLMCRMCFHMAQWRM